MRRIIETSREQFRSPDKFSKSLLDLSPSNKFSQYLSFRSIVLLFHPGDHRSSPIVRATFHARLDRFVSITGGDRLLPSTDCLANFVDRFTEIDPQQWLNNGHFTVNAFRDSEAGRKMIAQPRASFQLN